MWKQLQDAIPADAEIFKGRNILEQGTSAYLTPPAPCPWIPDERPSKVPAPETHDFRYRSYIEERRRGQILL